jgi:phosphoenolpyruvate-protein kinase (PTS system EI component)
VLLGLGIRELSMSAVSVPEVKATIRAMNIEDTQLLVKRIDRLSTAAEVRAMVSDFVFGLTEPRRERKA